MLLSTWCIRTSFGPVKSAGGPIDPFPGHLLTGVVGVVLLDFMKVVISCGAVQNCVVHDIWSKKGMIEV